MSKIDINEYHAKFTRQFKEIGELIDSSTSDIKLPKEQTLKLKDEIESIAHLLPRYQLLSYTDQVQALLDSIDKISRPQRRFRFSGKPTTTKEKRKYEIPFDLKGATVDPTITGIEASIINVLHKEGLITEVKNSIIIAENVDSLTLKHITSSILIVKSNGPVFISSAKGCSIFVSCHQLRIHDTFNTKFSASIPSGGAVIENCNHITFNEGIDVSDFQYPNGNSPNFKNTHYCSDFNEIPMLIRENGDDGLKHIKSLLQR